MTGKDTQCPLWTSSASTQSCTGYISMDIYHRHIHSQKKGMKEGRGKEQGRERGRMKWSFWILDRFSFRSFRPLMLGSIVLNALYTSGLHWSFLFILKFVLKPSAESSPHLPQWLQTLSPLKVSLALEPLGLRTFKFPSLSSACLMCPLRKSNTVMSEL